MNILWTVLQIVAPVFALGAIGFIWVRRGIDYPVAFVTRLAMTIAVPCLVFTALMKAQIEASALGAIFAASALAYGLMGVFVLAFLQLRGLSLRSYGAPLIFGNTGNLGLPLALLAFGEQGLGLAVVVFATSSILVFTLGVWLVSGSASPKAMTREPMVIATVLGAIFLWQGWQTPTVVTQTLDLVGQMAIPLMLITLGVAIGRLSVANIGRAVWLSLLKAALAVMAALLAGWLIGLPKLALGVLVVQMATPAAVSVYLLAEHHKADPQAAAGLVFASTLLSIGLVPLILVFFV